MKSIRPDEIKDRVRRLVQEANFILPEDVAACPPLIVVLGFEI